MRTFASARLILGTTFRAGLAFKAVLSASFLGAALAAAEPAAPPPRTIVIGFVGGRVHPDNPTHLEVRIAHELQKQHGPEAVVEVFANHHGEVAFREVMRLLDTDHDGTVSAAERRAARIVIYGHSWGGSQTIALAQQLDREEIPVLLTIQVDSIGKDGIHDGEIPGNVAEAINFFQTMGLLHGQQSIYASEPSRTVILGNFRSDYTRTHVDCRSFPWFARTFMLPHIEIENDPLVWKRIELLINQEIADADLTRAVPITTAVLPRIPKKPEPR